MVPADQVRVVAKDVGGSFGMKSGAYPEDVLVLYAARKLGRPVRWISERRESFLADDHGRDISIGAELGVDGDGRFRALKVDFTVNVGSYLSRRSLFLLNNIGGIAGVYRIPCIEASVTGVFTNTMTNAPYRGAGRPEATYVIERLIDIAARDLGLDPFELRRRNLVPPSAMPYDTGFLFKYDCGEFEENMLGAAKLADREGFAARKEESGERGMLRGLGMANPIEVAAGPFTKLRRDLTKLKVHPDGTATLYAGSMSTGQGIETTLTDLVARQLGLARDAIRYEAGDTDDLPDGRGNGGSGATAVGGVATRRAAEMVIATGRALAAELLEARPDAVGFADGRFPLEGSNRSVGLAEVARYAEGKHPAGLSETAEFTPPAVTFPNGCHMVEVEIDPDTGVVKIVRYSIVEDIGNVLNPTLAHGQIQGGVAMGVGQALGEVITYDAESGQLLSGSFMDYQMPRADDTPSVHLETRAVPTAVNPLGVKGVGEAGTVGSLVATINAVCDALSPWASGTSRCRRRPPASGRRSRRPSPRAMPSTIRRIGNVRPSFMSLEIRCSSHGPSSSTYTEADLEEGRVQGLVLPGNQRQPSSEQRPCGRAVRSVSASASSRQRRAIIIGGSMSGLSQPHPAPDRWDAAAAAPNSRAGGRGPRRTSPSAVSGSSRTRPNQEGLHPAG